MIKLLKIVYIFLIFSFLLLVAIPLFSQSNPIVQVDPVINLSDEVWLDAVCDAATDNVLFTLKFLGQFEVMSDSISENGTEKLIDAEVIDHESFDTSSLKTRAETEGYDNILFGSCTIENGSYVITMNAYDLALDKITYSGSTVVESIFDTFEAVDEITYQTVEGFSGIHVTYGSLVLVPPDTGEPFSFTIDGIALSEGTFSVGRMPAGVHELAVSQERPLGLYEFVHEIIVEEESENRIDIPLPNIVGEEIPIFNQADEYLTLISIGKEPGMPLVMNNLYSLLETPFFQDYRSGLVLKYDRWVSMMEGVVLVSDEYKNTKISFNTISLWPNEYRNFSKNSVSLSSQYDINLYNTVVLKPNMYLVADVRTISIDGNSDDWDLVSDSILDPEGDLITPSDINRKGRDVVEVKAALDNKNLYLMMRTSDGIYNTPNSVYSFHIGDNPVILAHFSTYEKELWVNKYYSSSNNKSWENILNKIKYASGDVLEISIPIRDLLNNTELEERTHLHYDITYTGSTSGWIDMEDYNGNEGILILSLSEALIRKDI